MASVELDTWWNHSFLEQMHVVCIWFDCHRNLLILYFSGKRKRIPTQKAIESDLDATLKIKVEEPDFNESSQDVPDDFEEAIPGSPAKPAKAPKKDKAAKESETEADKSEDDSAVKEKENKKPGPGGKVKKPRANIPCPRCGKMHRNEDHLEKHIMVVHEGKKEKIWFLSKLLSSNILL